MFKLLFVCCCGLVYSSYIFLLVCFVFFFFKQKTAYEMRISDWSSDVCSSDLIDADLVARNHFDMEYGRGVVLRIDAGEGRIAQDGGAQAIFGMQIRAA